MHVSAANRTALFLSVLFALSVSLTAQPSLENYTLVWADEFSGSGLPDGANWGYEKGCSIRNSELQSYTERRLENARIEEGNLVIEARKEVMDGCNYSSASLITRGKREFQYGIFEMRAKIDVRKGSWPAFWALGIKEEWPSNGEVDVMEYYNGALHANVAWGTDTRWTAKWDSQTKTVSGSFADTFHVWHMHWTKDFIKLYVDGELQNTTDLATTINGSLSTLKNPFHQKSYLLVNQAIGSNGGDPSGTQFPVKCLVDYIRVYQEKAGPTSIVAGTEGRNAGALQGARSRGAAGGTVKVFSVDGRLLHAGNLLRNTVEVSLLTASLSGSNAHGVYIVAFESAEGREIRKVQGFGGVINTIRQW